MGPTKMDGYCLTPTHSVFSQVVLHCEFSLKAPDNYVHILSPVSLTLYSRGMKRQLYYSRSSLLYYLVNTVSHRTNTPAIKPTTYERYFTQSVNQMKDMTLLPFLVLKHTVAEQDTN